jgi:rubrerythrin
MNGRHRGPYRRWRPRCLLCGALVSEHLADGSCPHCNACGQLRNQHQPGWFRRCYP